MAKTTKANAVKKEGQGLESSKINNKPTQSDILLKLEPSCKKMIKSTVTRYMNGNYASIFNESEMTALAQDTALEVARRVEIWNKNPEEKGAVDPKGCIAYFTTAFINQCQKMYEKYAKTDIRAAVQTVSSDEALLVAASRNLENPENQWILKSEINQLLNELEKIDNTVNQAVLEEAKAEGRSPQINEYQYSKFIIEKTLNGYEANEIRDAIGLSDADYSRHRKSALELAKERVKLSYSDLAEHFSDQVDPRIYTKEVKKRKKIPNRIRNYSVKSNFYIQSKISENKEMCITSLFVRIDILEDNDKTKEIPSKLIKIDETENSLEMSQKDREDMWNKTKDPNFIKKINEMGMNYLNDINKVA